MSKNMDFAKKQLEKYGWQEGKGLGKHEHGITNAIKPKLKFDNTGVGHDNSEQFKNNWWENLYNNATSNVNVSSANGSVEFDLKDADGVEITTKNYSLKNLKKNSGALEYGKFLKTSKLTEKGLIDLDNNNYRLDNMSLPKYGVLTDDQLFAACGGRTAHKGARHGLNLNGKLSRLEKQEKLLLRKLRKVSISDESDDVGTKKNMEKKLKKLDTHKNKYKKTMEEEDTELPSTSQSVVGITTSPYKNNKKRKKERKRVSFCETVTEFQTKDVELNSSDSRSPEEDFGLQIDDISQTAAPVVSVRQIKIKINNDDINNDNALAVDQDEGIDCSDFDTRKKKDTNVLQAKIKEDNKTMKRKIKKLRKKGHDAGTDTSDLLLQSDDLKLNEEHIQNSQSDLDKCYYNIVKRKCNIEQDDPNSFVPVKKRPIDNVSVNCHYSDIDSLQNLSKAEIKKIKKEKHLEKRISKVAESLNQICKISDVKCELDN